jgi:hypothetical protein
MMSISKRAAATLAFATALTTAPALAAPVCLYTDRIQNTSIKDVRTIDFHMKDGTVWRNTLRNACPDLKWWGFTYTISGPNEICDNLLSISVLHTGETCLLGKFAKVTPEPPTHM